MGFLQIYTGMRGESAPVTPIGLLQIYTRVIERGICPIILKLAA